jgi:hypothetical protein
VTLRIEPSIVKNFLDDVPKALVWKTRDMIQSRFLQLQVWRFHMPWSPSLFTFFQISES